jgi:hypothetical protein
MVLTTRPAFRAILGQFEAPPQLKENENAS